MKFTPKSYKDLEFPNMSLAGSNIEYVTSFKYLGHFICNDLRDDDDIAKCRRGIFMRGNIMLRKFSKCSDDVKTTLFRSYMTPLYCSSLWTVYTKASMNSLRIAYNSILGSSSI